MADNKNPDQKQPGEHPEGAMATLAQSAAGIDLIDPNRLDWVGSTLTRSGFVGADASLVRHALPLDPKLVVTPLCDSADTGGFRRPDHPPKDSWPISQHPS